jgi:hypothetical protein
MPIHPLSPVCIRVHNLSGVVCTRVYVGFVSLCGWVCVRVGGGNWTCALAQARLVISTSVTVTMAEHLNFVIKFYVNYPAVKMFVPPGKGFGSCM